MKNRSLFLFILLLFSCSFIFQNCEESEMPSLELKYSDESEKNENSKVNICHFAKSDNNWEVLTINRKSLEKHLNHGDVILDADGDGYAVFNECGVMNSWGIDCDDNDPDIYPGKIEIPYDGKDNDCNPLTLDDDLDRDGFPIANDCDDSNPDVNPGSNEICGNGVDDNCDGLTDDDCLKIGDFHEGGIVAYLLHPVHPDYDPYVQKGLICSPNDFSPVQWWNGSYIETGATDESYGAGPSNTTTIVAAQGPGTYAAKICDDLVLNGYEDWYLPSLWEMTAMRYNKDIIGNFNGETYWTSTEGSFYNAFVVKISWNAAGTQNKSMSFAFRPIRTLEYVRYAP